MAQARPPQAHPDAGRDTRRMPFEQLRTLVVSLIDADDDPVAEFDAMPTTCLPGPRTSTLDQLIAALPRYERFPRGSSAAIRPETEPTVRSAAYTTRRAADDAATPAPTRRIRGRTAGGRGSHRR